jgi:group I intron endonuclease
LSNNILSSKSQISKELNNNTGVYYFYNRITSGGYVGSSQNLLRRIKEHLLEDSSQSSILLQRAIAKYKIDNFTLYILAIIDLTQEYSKSEIKDLLLAKEQLYLDHKDLDSSYNILKIAGSPIGSKQSEETKLLRSEIMAGENNPMFGKIGELNPFFNKKHTLESKLKMSSIKLGKELSLETRAKLREIGLKNSDKSRENLLKAKELHFEKFKMQQDIFKEKMKALSKKVYLHNHLLTWVH